ncbi:putative membrane protein [Wickerhamomyces ciferrii]|uniref:Membrane protein n=1 Tax=Wickerhamomyces ciferrii (strain ATCC 14091 / BCRC 22168 / CBS 111 / JCM 3599 / NBRC 0793 / NRRL Y-1031 F-60-10) TaxID=1206466 RepID=K0KN13_WICCF|nr:uncharacterized protein BN7_2062 [Wickerhamomyces ciferrii]CCH42518.1 putative membrane protein [Wickerhamomyces ciferrii]
MGSLKETTISKWDTDISTELDLEAGAGVNSNIRFVEGWDERGRQLSRNVNRPSSLSRRISMASIETSLSRTKVEPNVALPPIFKTISYRVEDDQLSVHKKKQNKTETSVQNFKETTWHVKTIDEIANSLSTDPFNGLTTEQFEKNLKIFGFNQHTPPKTNWLKKIFMYFFGGFGSLLLIGGILCCISWKPLGNPNPAVANLALGVVLFLVFFLQAGFNFWQDFTSSRVMNSINGMLPSDSNVKRDGLKTIEEVKNLVSGDLIFISNGDRLPADVRFVSIEGNDFAFDRSILTGESKPIVASKDPDEKGSNYLESSCIGLQGTYCVGGSGYGIIVSTGDNTVFGKIAKLSSEPKSGLSPLQKEILRFVFLTVSIVITLIVILCIIWGAWLRKSYPDWIPVSTLIVDLVSVAVAFIPEGLPIALTTCLIITAGAMKKNKILCKSLSVVETLGSVSTICSDKTGTLTKNKMFVTSYSVGIDEISENEASQSNDVSADDLSVEGDVSVEDGKSKDSSIGLTQLSRISKLCNSASFNPTTMNKPIKERLITGNATDQAILRFGEELDPDHDLYQEWTQKAEVSFNSKNKFMIRLFEKSNVQLQHLQLFIKGAPDILLPKCLSYQNQDGEVVQLNDESLLQIQNLQKSWAMKGQRVVLLAYKPIHVSRFANIEFSSKIAHDKLMEESESGLILSGLVGITDPPKDDIFDVVTTLKGAGIKFCMVTGDFELTAVAIAKMCNILTTDEIANVNSLDINYPVMDPSKTKLCDRVETEGAISISGPSLNFLNENQWEHLTSFEQIVFARTTPEQKLRIVEEFQKRGHIVGMTGDGVNDAPSLRQADIGIAMAEGSDIAKEASDLVLLESFSSMVTALKYGRLVFENLKKTVVYLLPAGTYGELWPVLLNVIFGLPQVLSSFCMIIICCLTDCAGAITLAYESPEKNLLEKKPRSITGNRLVNLNLLLHSYFTVGTYYCFVAFLMSFLYYREKGIPFSVLSLSYGEYPANYSADKISELTNTVSSIYFITLVIMQFFNLFATRTRYLSVFQQKPIFDKTTSNYPMFIAIVFGLAVTFFFNYIPWFQNVLNTSPVPAKFYFIALGFGAVVLIYDELRKFTIRKYPNCLWAKVAW